MDFRKLPPEIFQKLPPPAQKGSFTSVTSDSRAVGAGTLFVAVRGTAQDGHFFIRQAVEGGAVLIVGSDQFKPVASDLGAVPYVGVADERLALARIAAAFYGHPSEKMRMIGVTGTSGKTTTTYLIESILRAAGKKAGVIGTVEFRFGAKRYPSTHTTPGPVELQKLLAEMQADGCEMVVMEVSSHALRQHRTAAIRFEGVVFTNLSREHLDFHPDMEDYFRAKASLFTDYPGWSVAVVNRDDAYGKRLIAELAPRSAAVATFGKDSLKDVRLGERGIHGTLGGIPIDSSLVGAFNAMNLFAAIELCRGLGIPPAAIAEGVKNAVPPPGRLERVKNDRGIHVLVDYAHKPDALEKILEVLAPLKGSHRLFTVFGCGGDRDRTKRPVMGALAVRYSDHVWVTSDNPRTEDPGAIIEEILAGIPQGSTRVTVEADRKKAIFAAIFAAQPGDWVLIAGKGHEDYQIIGTKKIHFDDREVAAEALRNGSG
jgi:UDP-N-acetylmuramoyl-L-alanyl-D-glutamate--2,6-diaminopimelate ligase